MVTSKFNYSSGFTPLETTMFYTYVLRSKKDDKLYTGATEDLRERFRLHNNGKVFSTKGRGPFELIYYEACGSSKDAFMREKYLKSGPGKRFLKNRLKRSLPLTGFTLIEIMIGLGLLVIIISLGLFLSMDLYRSYAFRSEQDTVLSIMHRARTRSLSNINQSPHGVHFEADKYVMFEGAVFDPLDTSNEEFQTSGVVSHSPATLDTVFDQLTGNTSSGILVLSGQGRTATISFNSEGRIDW